MMMRGLGFAAAAMLLAMHAPGAFAQVKVGINADGTITPAIAVQREEYARARAGFRTKLRWQRPSPQGGSVPATPPDARAIGYTSGGRMLTAWVGMPAGVSGKPPVVIFLHGGFAFGQEDFDMAAPYRAAGYAVVVPLLRGENGQKGNFSLFYDEVDDVLAVAALVRASPEFDASRVYLAGHSVGGTLTMLAAMADGRFRAVASFSGSPDQLLFTRLGMRPGEVPFDATDMRELEMRSPLAYAASLKMPARLYYGSEENFFPMSTERTAAIAAAAGHDVKAQQIKGGHMSAVPAEIAASITFFREH